jgi:signal transduction histidine kinase/type II secretory pathway pseudopilin PulG
MLALVRPVEENRGEASTRRGRLGGPVLALVVLIAGIAATALIVVALRDNQRDNAEQVMDQRTAVALAAVQTETERYRAMLESTAAGISTDDSFTWDDFDVATAPLATADLAGAVSVAYVVPSRTDEIAATQSLWRSRGAEGLTLRPTGPAGTHYFSIFTRMLNQVGEPLDGVDVRGSPEASAALTYAQQVGQPTVSDTYVLLRDRELPAAEQQHSFVFVAPIWTRAPIPAFRGWLVLGMRGQDFLSGVLRTVSQGQLDGRLLATTTGGARSTVADYSVPGHPSLSRHNDFTVADQEWTLLTRADPSRLPGAHSMLPPTVLIGCLAITVMLAGLVWVLATGRSRAVARVRDATRELRAAEAESRRQAGLLRAIMDSIGDGVGVVDEHGAFLLHNPAAKELLGIDLDNDDPDAWQEHYGLFRPDGRTPFPLDDLPLMRALAGHSSNGVEMIVRNPQRPDGLLISVDGRPLGDRAGQRGAVAVFHDITALRRYENDLAIFAGVVAHDLKAPLAVIRGHCEVADEDLARFDQAEAVRKTLGRVVRAVDRMAALIDTLLAYTTARDAPLKVIPVELAPLVDEVVHDRVSYLPADRQPDVYVGPMPAVGADPAMLRHVLDNLIGNALKYVGPGATPRVDVTASPEPGGGVRIEVADRGIGIPEADKSEVFETFHRSTAAAGYAGTGLGLAICKRIVERHGGAIGVADNPGGGTRFFFTLPSVGPAVAHRKETEMSQIVPPEDDAAVRAALERALAERANMENSRLPGMSALPAAEPSAHREPAARLRAPVPDHQHGN